MTQIEILELALEGAAARLGAATRELARAAIGAILGSETGEAVMEYWRAVLSKTEAKAIELRDLIAAETAGRAD